MKLTASLIKRVVGNALDPGIFPEQVCLSHVVNFDVSVLYLTYLPSGRLVGGMCDFVIQSEREFIDSYILNQIFLEYCHSRHGSFVTFALDTANECLRPSRK